MYKRILFFAVSILTIALLAQNSNPRWIHLLKEGKLVDKYRVIEDFDSVVVNRSSGNNEQKVLHIMKNGASIKQYNLYSEIDNLAVLEENDMIDTRDGNIYKTVQIGRQVWMAENLKYLPEVSGSESGSNTEPYYYVYDYDGTDVEAAKATENYQTYGVLYNWPAAMAGETESNKNPSRVRGICPEGWHLPSRSEWEELNANLGENAGGKLKHTEYWSSPNEGATNETEFSALPGGGCVNSNFQAIKLAGYWWSSSEDVYDYLTMYLISYESADFRPSYAPSNYCFSVRCVRDYPSYTLKLLSADDTMGTVAGENEYVKGEEAVIEAKANFGYKFVNWTGDTDYIQDANSATTILTMPANEISLTANFAKANYYDNIGSFIDERDNTKYNTIKIGNQIWMAENLKYLPEVSDAASFSLKLPYYYVYGYNGNIVEEAKTTENFKTYGVLYNWDAAVAGDAAEGKVQGVCPDGWHLPSDAELTKLKENLGSNVGGKMKHTEFWAYPNTGANNESGFSALPGGHRHNKGSNYELQTFKGEWWSSSSDKGVRFANYWHLSYDSDNLTYMGILERELGSSVRCIKYEKEFTLSLSSTNEDMGVVIGEGAFGVEQIVEIEARAKFGYKFAGWTGDTSYLEDADVAKIQFSMPASAINLTASFEKAEYYDNIGSFVDSRDNTSYNTIKIGNQTWMAENLKYLPEVNGLIMSLGDTPYYYVYGYDGNDTDEAKALETYKTSGVIYNWYAAATDSSSGGIMQDACPEGWHLPSDAEWEELNLYLGENAGGKLMHTGYWIPNPYANNESGFSAIPGGYFNGLDFFMLENYANYWSATEHSADYANSWRIGGDLLYHFKGYGKTNGYSVRCVRDYPKYTFNLFSSDEEQGSVIGAGEYIEGEEVEVKAIANFGYKFVNWTGDTEYIQDVNATTTILTMPAKEISLTANFAKAEYYDNIGSFIDERDQTEYNTIKIGNQVWMAENLKYLTEVSGPGSLSYSKPYYYVYDYNGTDVEVAKATENYQTYGVLYNWPAVMAGYASSNSNPSGVQGICPEGWHLPSDAEWIELENYLIANGYNYDGTTTDNKIAIAMAEPGLWSSDNGTGTIGNSANYPGGANRSGFSALPGGFCSDDGYFYDITGFGYWWSSSDLTYTALSRTLYYNNSFMYSYSHQKVYGFSVRCVRD